MAAHVFLYRARTRDDEGPLADMHFETAGKARQAAMTVAGCVPHVTCFVIEDDQQEIERWHKAHDGWRLSAGN